MCFGFGISQDDVENVLRSHNVDFDDERMDEIMAVIDDSAIESASLAVDPTDDDDETLMIQTDAAYDEIAWQLYQAGIIQREQISKYGNPVLLDRME